MGTALDECSLDLPFLRLFCNVLSNEKYGQNQCYSPVENYAINLSIKCYVIVVVQLFITYYTYVFSNVHFSIPFYIVFLFSFVFFSTLYMTSSFEKELFVISAIH